MRHCLALLLILFLPDNAHAVHECGMPHAQEHPSTSQPVHGCDTLKETDFFYGDARADAPKFAPRGKFQVGVRTVKLTNPDQLDILNYSAENPNPRYDRPLTLEVWYPATLRPRQRELTHYNDVLGHGAGNPERPLLPFEFGGRAARDAEALNKAGPYPLIIVSHGYSGSRVLMTWLTENLASKGYVVVAIDHTESTHADAAGIASTMIHRPRDINFTLQSVAAMNRQGNSFLAELVDVNRTAVIGYSMGSYGALSAAGVGVSQAAVSFPGPVPGGHLGGLQAGKPEYQTLLDSRIKALIAFAPYAPAGFWDSVSIEKLSIPSLFIVGAQDQTTGYAAAQWLFDNAVNSERYLLVYQGAIHEVGANPAPPLADAHFREYVHYQEPAWDNRRLNNINQHFVTAFLGVYLRGEQYLYEPYLDMSPISSESPRTDTAHPDYWRGFLNWTAIGMELHRGRTQIIPAAGSD
jgi:predicted dienelactone hydrolase